MSLTKNVLLKLSFAQERRRRSESEYFNPPVTDDDKVVASEAESSNHNGVGRVENSFPIFVDKDDSVFSSPSRDDRKGDVKKDIDVTPSKRDRGNDSPEKENKGRDRLHFVND